ncbi:MAG: hypothetical protein ACNS60_16500 [Candidatus Cyclobacteriaceae bacterium M2_1C_046]
MRISFLLILFCAASLVSTAQTKSFYILTDKTTYFAEEKINIGVWVVDYQKMQPVQSLISLNLDIVAHTGQVVHSAAINHQSNNYYNFPVPDSLSSGIYRIITYAENVKPAVKRIKIYNPNKQPASIKKDVAEIKAVLETKKLVSDRINNIYIKVLNEDQAGIEALGSIRNENDSILSYLKTDVNGIVQYTFKPINEQYYTIIFGETKLILKADSSAYPYMELSSDDKSYSLNTSSFTTKEKLFLSVSHEGSTIFTEMISPGVQLRLPKATFPNGVLEFNLTDSKKKIVQRKLVLNHPKTLTSAVPISNSYAKRDSISFNLDAASHDDLILVDVNETGGAQSASFYKDFYFNQRIADLHPADFTTPYLYFYNPGEFYAPEKIDDFSPLCSYENRFYRISFFLVNHLKSLDIYCEDYKGVMEVQNKIPAGETPVLVYLFDERGNRLEKLNLKRKERSNNYPAIKQGLIVDEELLNKFSNHQKRQQVITSYAPDQKEGLLLKPADYVVELNNFNIPPTTERLIRELIPKTAIKTVEGRKELRLFPFGSSYIYEGAPLILINNIPTFDFEEIISTDPKFIEKVEIRNSIKTVRQFGLYGLNGVISFTLADGAENPLKDEVKGWLVLSGNDVADKNYTSDNFPDLREKLLWNPTVAPGNQLKIRNSDINSNYTFRILRITKKGEVNEYTATYSVQ